MVNCWISGGKDDVGGSLTLGYDFPGGGQTDEASDQKIIFLELLKRASEQAKCSRKWIGRRKNIGKTTDHLQNFHYNTTILWCPSA